MGRIDHRQLWNMPELPLHSKIVFLNKENLVEFEGYKASVEIFGGLLDKDEIHIVLTGFSYNSAKALFDKLKALPKNEIYSSNSGKPT
jgi:hypothetical protein